MTEELMPCPFCGTDRISISYSTTLQSFEPRSYFVECEECAACGPTIDIELDEPQGRAADAWNTRIESTRHD